MKQDVVEQIHEQHNIIKPLGTSIKQITTQKDADFLKMFDRLAPKFW